MSESLKEKTAKGLLWGGISNGMQQLLNLFFGSAVEISAMAVVGYNDSIPTVFSLLDVVVFVIADHKFSSFIILAPKL